MNISQTGLTLAGLLAAFAQAHAAVSLGTAATFGVLANTTITNTGPSFVSGNIGVSPGSAISGFFGTSANEGPGNFTGTAHQADTQAEQAQTDALAAFNALNALAINTTTVVGDLGGQTLGPGVYGLGFVEITGDLTLSGAGEYVFQIGSTLTTSFQSSVVLVNGADASNVFWAVGSSATLGSETNFAGNLIAHTSATLTTDASVDGRVIALNGAVTMDTNMIIPEPGTLSMLVILSFGLMAQRRRTAS